MPAGAATVDGLAFPLAVAHRGGANLFPENTLAAFEGAVALGCPAVEAGDLQLTADGVLVAMHDTTVDRTTTGRGNVGDLTLAEIRALAVDASRWFDGGWADQPVPTFAEVLDRIGGSAVLVPESKSVGTKTTPAIVEAVCARSLQESVIVQSFRLDELALVAEAGIAPLFLMHSGREATPAAIAETGARFVGLYKDAADLAAVAGRLTDAGLRVLAYTVDTQVEHDRVLAAGCDGVFTNEPLYVSGRHAYRTTRAPWPADGTFGSGMLVYPGVGPLLGRSGMPGGRGGFVGTPGAWRWTLDRSPYLAGPVCPVEAGSYTVTVRLVFDRPPASDLTRWGGLYVGVETDECPDRTDPPTGYRVALRWNGELEVSVRTAAGMRTLGVTTTSPIAGPFPQEVTIAVDKTPSGFTVRRPDDGAAATYDDTTWSGGYLFLRNDGDDVAAISCADLTIDEGGDAWPATS